MIKEPVHHDFNAMVTRALEDYPQLAANTVFLSTSEHKNATALTLRGDLSAVFAQSNNPARMDQLLDLLRMASQLRSSFFNRDHDSGFQAVILNPDSKVLEGYGSADDRAGFSLRHEQGHFLTQRGLHIGASTPISENSGDAFGTIETLRSRAGQADFLTGLPTARAQEFILTGKSTHMTVPTIAAILSSTENFAAFTPQEALAISDEYAARYTPSAHDLHDAQNTFGMFRNFRCNPQEQRAMAQRLMETRHPFSAQIGCQALLPLLCSTSGIALLPPDLAAEIAAKLKRRMHDMSLADKIIMPTTAHQKPPGSQAPGRF